MLTQHESDKQSVKLYIVIGLMFVVIAVTVGIILMLI